MDFLFDPVPLTIMGTALFLILGVLVGRFWSALQITKDVVMYGVIVPLFVIWALNTVAGVEIAFTYWNCVAVGVLNFALMLTISAGVHGGVTSATPEPPSPDEIQERLNSLDSE